MELFTREQERIRWRSRRGLLEILKGRNASKAILAIDIHAIRTANTLATGFAQSQGVVHRLDAQNGIEQHTVCWEQFQLVVLHVRLVVLLWVIAVNAKFHL